MNRNSWLAKLVDRDLGSFPGRIGEIISSFKVFQEGGWGKGLSGRHFLKLIDRDESIFTTTWAELRRAYFRELQSKISRKLEGMEVPLPRHWDGRVLTDKEIREKVKDGFRLMYCPLLDAKDLNESFLFPSHRYFSMRNGSDWDLEIKKSSRMTGKPYWFWIDCTPGGTTFYSESLSHYFPTLIEYLVADFVFREETSMPLDENIFIWLRHSCRDQRYSIFGGKGAERVLNSGIKDFSRIFEGATEWLSSVKCPINVRFTKVI